MATPPPPRSLNDRMAMLETQNSALLALAGLNLFLNIATILAAVVIAG